MNASLACNIAARNITSHGGNIHSDRVCFSLSLSVLFFLLPLTRDVMNHTDLFTS